MTTEPSYYFSLDAYAHKELFEGIVHVWESLDKLKPYLDKYCQSATPLDAFKGVYFKNPSLIRLGQGVSIEPGAYIEGPCFIGDGTSIRHGAYIRGYVATGRNCVIGHGTEIKHSILLDEVCAAHFNYVGDCILGNRVNLGAGVKCANLRLDHRQVRVRIGREKIDTGLKKLGAIIGDQAQLGCNSVTNPGVLLGPGVLCAPCKNISGFVARDIPLTHPTHSFTS